MGPTWVLSAPDGPHVVPMSLALSAVLFCGRCSNIWSVSGNHFSQPCCRMHTHTITKSQLFLSTNVLQTRTRPSVYNTSNLFSWYYTRCLPGQDKPLMLQHPLNIHLLTLSMCLLLTVKGFRYLLRIVSEAGVAGVQQTSMTRCLNRSIVEIHSVGTRWCRLIIRGCGLLSITGFR